MFSTARLRRAQTCIRVVLCQKKKGFPLFRQNITILDAPPLAQEQIYTEQAPLVCLSCTQPPLARMPLNALQTAR
jgi:hypothetical protein